MEDLKIVSLFQFFCNTLSNPSSHFPIEWLHVIERPAASTAATLGHVHRLKDKVLHRPHWCDACGKFIVGVHAYRCAECPLLIHKECVKAVGNAVVDI